MLMATPQVSGNGQTLIPYRIDRELHGDCPNSHLSPESIPRVKLLAHMLMNVIRDYRISCM